MNQLELLQDSKLRTKRKIKLFYKVNNNLCILTVGTSFYFVEIICKYLYSFPIVTLYNGGTPAYTYPSIINCGQKFHIKV